MRAVADTGALYALYDADEKDFARVREALATLRGPIYIPEAILGELDYLLRAWLGVAPSQTPRPRIHASPVIIIHPTQPWSAT